MRDGSAAERKVRHELEAEGWWVCRAAGSLGDADLVALRPWHDDGSLIPAEARLVEVKANTAGGPFMNFRPADRERLRKGARRAGADAYLAYCEPRKPTRWIPEWDWPEAMEKAA